MDLGMRRWKVLEWKERPETVQTVPFACPLCWRDALLPIDAAVVVRAQLASGSMVADGETPGGAPNQIACPHCRRWLELETKT